MRAERTTPTTSWSGRLTAATRGYADAHPTPAPPPPPSRALPRAHQLLQAQPHARRLRCTAALPTCDAWAWALPTRFGW